MNESSSNYTPVAEINVTPLVDVMLVLLIIFMITAPMLVTGVNVDLPETEASSVAGKDEPLAVSIDKKGLIYIDDKKTTYQALIPTLKAVAGENNTIRIFIRADKGIDYGKVMKIVSAINSAGFTQLALLTEPE
jgi:biopolymer transport protein TolR